MPSLREKFANTLSLVRFSHTVFALPFALGSMLVAADGLPSWHTLALILVCMISARTAAMAFNRYTDWELDQDNPRTAGRHKLATKAYAGTLAWSCAAIFVAATWWMNLLCFLLSPIAVGIIFFYSLTKRFTHYAHAFLGLALAISPMGAWAAVQGSLLAWPPWLLAASVLLWVFGFDLIYATQDTDHDRRAGLHSFPARYGNEAALRLARILHSLSWILLGTFGLASNFGWPFTTGWLLVGATLLWEHRAAQGSDTASINQAFFQANTIVGALVLLTICAETLL